VFWAVLGAVLQAVLLTLDSQSHEMLASGEAQNEPGREGEGGQAGFRIDRFDLIDRLFLTLPDDSTASGCQHILIPIDLRSIGKLDDDVITSRRNNQWSLVRFATASPDVPDDRERSVRTLCDPAGQGIQGVLEKNTPTVQNSLLDCHVLPRS
jgi:hypothetical protein